jgi:3-methyladenine DNA glycosylase AlkD
MTVNDILEELEQYGDENTKNTLIKHGTKEPFFGVKVADLKKILRKTKKNHELSLELFDTGNSDAMYLAGLMADEKKITKEQLNDWANKAYWYYLSEYSVPKVAAESRFGFELGKEWINSDLERVASAGWATLANYAGINDDHELDIDIYSDLLELVENNIHTAQNRVRYAMNGFVISVGTNIQELTEKAINIASKIGKVDVNVGGTACKVPLAKDYIDKTIKKGNIGKKRKPTR